MAAARVLLLGLGAASTAVLILRRKILAHWRKKTSYGGLESLVSFSSRLIAAARAVESLRPDAFVVDPLARILAGPQAMDKYKDDPIVKEANAAAASSNRSTCNEAAGTSAGGDNASMQQQQQQQQGPSSCTEAPAAGSTGSASEDQQQQRPVPRLIMRTCFFDDAALAAVGRPAARSAAALGPLLQHMAQQGLQGCKQVVLLGSGMDTRPWRLDLPPGVAWFEVDRHDVLAAKQAELTRAGVEFTTNNNTSSSGSGGSGGSSGCCLRASSWGCAAADLQLAGWTQQLLAAGLDASRPIAWLAEGLMYYLEPDCVGAMLQEASRISPPGSILALNFMTAEGLALLHNRAAAGAGAAAAAAPTTAEGSTAGAAGEAAGTAVQGSSDNSSSGNAGSVQAKPSGLMSQFKWGCPDNVEEFFSEHGWRVLVRHSWTRAALAYNWQPQLTPAAVGRPESQEVQFAVAVIEK